LDTTHVNAVLDAVDEHFERFVKELQELCRLRSRRSEPENMKATAEFIAESIQRMGGEAEVIPWNDSHPYVIGRAGTGSRRLLNFAHYDVEVEPTGDESEWICPPYAAEIVDGVLYARGVADDKGALMSRLHAVEAFRLAGQEVPVEVRFLIEGKIALNSPGLGSFFEAHRDRLEADGVLWENSWCDGQGRPLIKLGEKGILYIKLVARPLKRTLTSQNAALLPNAAWRLVWALSSLKDSEERVTIPGFYDEVRPLTEEESELLAEVEFDAGYLLDRAGVDRFMQDVSSVEAARLLRTVPTVTIGGMVSGDLTDEITLGLPGSAEAKVEIRLVPHQDPDRVLEAIRSHLDEHGFSDVGIEVIGASRPHVTDHRDPFVGLVADAARRAYGKEPVIEPYTTWIGNQGVCAGMPIVGVGVSRADSGIDGPNEHILLEDYRKGIKHVVEIMAAMA
jgi:acetylornithine deacetylase/succinyl-diaminopimelate desuccinylase-like protein